MCVRIVETTTDVIVDTTMGPVITSTDIDTSTDPVIETTTGYVFFHIV